MKVYVGKMEKTLNGEELVKVVDQRIRGSWSWENYLFRDKRIGKIWSSKSCWPWSGKSSRKLRKNQIKWNMWNFRAEQNKWKYRRDRDKWKFLREWDRRKCCVHFIVVLWKLVSFVKSRHSTTATDVTFILPFTFISLFHFPYSTSLIFAFLLK